MPGFIMIKGNLKNNFKKYKNHDLLIENINFEEFNIQRRTIKKFLNDKIFYNDKNYIILTEGMIFNKIELIKKYKKDNFKDTLLEMYRKNGEKFFNEFRGSFSGIFIDKKNKKEIVYTDHIGDKQIYYFISKEGIIVATKIEYILETLKINNINYSLDEVGCYCLLTCGYMLESVTLFKQVKKLNAGKYLKINRNKIDIIEYHRLDNKPNNTQTDEEIIEKIDKLFTQAIKRQVEKNREYNYEDIAPLSAGLDSRMTVFGLKKIKKIKNMLNFSYSETNYLDEKIPKKISEDLKLNWFFKSLDNGLNLRLIDDINKITDGMVLYSGPAQVLDTFDFLDMKNKGIIHTGMLGDVVLGTYYQEKNKNVMHRVGDGAYSLKLINKLKTKLENYKLENYQNQEIFKIYNRGFTGINMGSPLIFQEKSESFSPFYDLDFLEYCLTIPVEKRWKHYIYDKWVMIKYPEAAKYSHNGRKIGTGYKEINFFGKVISLNIFFPKLINYILRYLKLKKESSRTKNNMNPMDYWYNKNSELKKYMDNYYNENINKLDDYLELKKDVSFLYTSGSVSEKTQALTLLSALKLYF